MSRGSSTPSLSGPRPEPGRSRGSSSPMTPLQLRSNVAGREDRFVVRLNASAEPLTRRAFSQSGGVDAYLDFKGADGAIYGFTDGSIEILGDQGPELDGDVLLVDPVSRIAQRLIRARSSHNTFLITEQCDQLCIMCS